MPFRSRRGLQLLLIPLSQNCLLWRLEELRPTDEEINKIILILHVWYNDNTLFHTEAFLYLVYRQDSNPNVTVLNCPHFISLSLRCLHMQHLSSVNTDPQSLSLNQCHGRCWRCSDQLQWMQNCVLPLGSNDQSFMLQKSMCAHWGDGEGKGAMAWYLSQNNENWVCRGCCPSLH